MEKEINYLSERIEELEGKLSTLDFLIEEKIEGIVIELVKVEAEELKTEIELLNNILNFITIKALSEPVEEDIESTKCITCGDEACLDEECLNEGCLY
jgi:hypothetical protein